MLDSKNDILDDKKKIEEFENQKKEYKKSIQELIEKNLLQEAKFMIDEYEKIVKNDFEVYSIKSIIAILEERFDQAKSILSDGLVLDENNFDLLFNFAYLHHIINKYETAQKYYKKALLNARNNEEEKISYDNLVKLGVNESKEDLIRNIISENYYNKALLLKQENNNSDSALYYGLAYKYSTDNKFKENIKKKYNENKILKNIFNVAAKSTKKRFIILSSCDWGDVQQRMHHLSKSLVKLENQVIYITPSKEINIEYRNDIDVNIIYDKLVEYSISNSKSIDGVDIYSPVFKKVDEKVSYNNYIALIQRLLDNQDKEVKNVIITYMPYQANVINCLKGDFIHIYDCVDDHMDVEYAFWGSKQDVVLEQKLMDISDIITTTSISLYLQKSIIEGRSNIYLSRNAVNESDFIKNSNDIPLDLLNIPEPRIIYSGAIYKWFDKELFYSIVKSNPDKSFVIIGFGSDDILTEKYDNLYILGAKKHSELKQYLTHCQVGIIPFKDDIDLIINCDPIKQYEYIACGLPVISTYMPEAAIDKIYTYLANTKEQFNEAIEKCLNLKMDNNKIMEFITKNSWNSRACLLCRIIDNSIDKKEKEDMLKNIGKNLDIIVDKYKSPIFKTLRALYLKMTNISAFEEITKEAYKESKNKYIERQYLTSLLCNLKIDECINVALESIYIRDEIKKELLFLKENDYLRYAEPLIYIGIGSISKGLEKINKINNSYIKKVYNCYVDFLLSNKINNKELDYLLIENYKNPLVKFLKLLNSDNIKGEKIIIANLFNGVSEEFINLLTLNNIILDSFIGENDSNFNNKVISIQKAIEIQRKDDIRIIVPYDYDYVKQIRVLAENGIKKCDVALIINNKIVYINIDEKLINSVKNKEYNKTITLNRFNAADGNVHALIKYIPERYKEKYKLNVIYGKDVWSLDNIIKVPLKSNVTVSGFSTFLYNYPKFTYNIEVGHGGVTIKACGALDKKDKNSGGNRDLYEKMDCMCIDSYLNMTLNSAFYGIPENKYEITGLPRYDIFSKVDSKKNLEKLLNVNLENKKIIFNMPTFHIFDQCNRIEGAAELNDSIKIVNFDYSKFNKFLIENNMICISKVHHGEEVSVSAKNKNRKYSNIYFINNDDLEMNNLNVYEVLGAGDILITDYSSVYNDFLFLNRPVIFVSSDIEEYRKERGLALEPYDFWTAGPKVIKQDELHFEVLKYVNGVDEYKSKRHELKKVFFNYTDGKSIDRLWEVIDDRIERIVNNKYIE